MTDQNNQTAQHTEEVSKWLQAIEDAKGREKDWRKEGKRVLKIYEADKGSQNQFNILYSNTETLSPALYSNTPRPVVDRRFKDEDPVGKAASSTTERMLGFLIDTNEEDYSKFDELMESAVMEALLPGRGVTRFKYDAGFETVPAQEEGQEPTQKIAYETVCGEPVHWDNIILGYARKWKQVPWLAFEHFMDRQELEETFGDAGNEVVLTVAPGQEDQDNDKDDNSWKKEGENGKPRFARVFEIWDKQTKMVLFISEGASGVLKRTKDPLGISTFFPMPCPLTFTLKVSDMVPVPLYKFYEAQAIELNAVTTRINKLIHALKIRGFYDATIEGMEQLMQKGDNTLLPAENVSAMLQGQTLEKAIWFFPIEKLVPVLQQLYLNREQIKTVIYEVTGISDILRGSSAASETATAQNIKNQWGTLRLRKMQKRVQQYARDCLRIMAEIGINKLQSQTIIQMTGLKYPTDQQQAMAKQALANIQQQAQSLGQQPPPDQLQTMQTVVSMPTWETIFSTLKNKLTREYKIDIETNSTVEADATEDKQQVNEFLNALAQFLNGIGPAVEQGFITFDVAKTMLLAITRRFRFGDVVEDALDKMQPPPPKGPDPSQQLDLQMKQMDMQAKQQDHAAKAQATQQKMEADQQKHRMELQKMVMEERKMQQEAELSEREHAMKLEEQAMNLKASREKAALDIQTARHKAHQARKQQKEKGKT
jgi:hypothetical protein